MRKDSQADLIEYALNKKISPHQITKRYKLTVKTWCEKYELNHILSSIEHVDTYLQRDSEDEITAESANLYLQKMSGILYIRSKSVMYQRFKHLDNVGKSRCEDWDSEEMHHLTFETWKNKTQQHDSFEDFLSQVIQAIKDDLGYFDFEDFKAMLEEWGDIIE